MLYIDNVLTLLASFLETPKFWTASPVKTDFKRKSAEVDSNYTEPSEYILQWLTFGYGISRQISIGR